MCFDGVFLCGWRILSCMGLIESSGLFFQWFVAALLSSIYEISSWGLYYLLQMWYVGWFFLDFISSWWLLYIGKNWTLLVPLGLAEDHGVSLAKVCFFPCKIELFVWSCGDFGEFWWWESRARETGWGKILGGEGLIQVDSYCRVLAFSVLVGVASGHIVENGLPLFIQRKGFHLLGFS